MTSDQSAIIHTPQLHSSLPTSVPKILPQPMPENAPQFPQIPSESDFQSLREPRPTPAESSYSAVAQGTNILIPPIPLEPIQSLSSNVNRPQPSSGQEKNFSRGQEDNPELDVARSARERKKASCSRHHSSDRRPKSFQGHCHSLHPPDHHDLPQCLRENYSTENFRLRKFYLGSVSTRESFFDLPRMSPARFRSRPQMRRNPGEVIEGAHELEMDYSDEVGDINSLVAQRKRQVQVLDQEVDNLAAWGSDIQEFFRLDIGVYPIKVSSYVFFLSLKNSFDCF